MGNFLNSLRRTAWLRSLAYLILGIFSLVEPKATLNSFIYVIAGFVAFFGIINIFTGLRIRGKQQDITDYSLQVGILQLIAAVLIAVLTKPLLSILPIMLGVGLGVTGLSRIFDASRRKTYVNVSPLPWIIYGIAMVIIGLLLVFNPFRSILLVLRLFGIILIVMSVMEVLRAYRFKN